jgi:hypothetical protein
MRKREHEDLGVDGVHFPFEPPDDFLTYAKRFE